MSTVPTLYITLYTGNHSIIRVEFLYNTIHELVQMLIHLFNLYFQSVSTKRVSEGGHAKVQFVCQLLHRVDENSWIDLDITVKQEEEPNKIQFISRKKVCIVPD